jgi:asparagine synthase (glutamine-hydrolysing)
MMYADQVEYLPDDLLVKVDRTSMSIGLEVRVPLLDYRLVEYAWRTPFALKYSHGQTKWLLKEVLRRYLPDRLIDRPKMGFQIPVKEWLRGPLRPWADDLLATESIAAAGIFEPRLVSRMWDEHRAGKRHWHYRLWSILMFQAWFLRSVQDDR